MAVAHLELFCSVQCGAKLEGGEEAVSLGTLLPPSTARLCMAKSPALLESTTAAEPPWNPQNGVRARVVLFSLDNNSDLVSIFKYLRNEFLFLL